MSMPVLSLCGLGVKYGQLQALQGVMLDITAGERVAVIGPNGAGKSSLFDAVSGVAALSGGDLWLADRRIDHLPVQERARLGLMRSFQRTRLFSEMTVAGHLRCAAYSRYVSGWRRYAFWREMKGDVTSEKRLQEVAGALGLPLDEAVTALSYAGGRLLELGMMLVADAKVLLLDEPTAGLSREEADFFLRALEVFARDKTILFIEHDMQVVRQLSDRVAVLWEGKILAVDTWEMLAGNSDVNAVWPLDALNMPDGGEPCC